MNTDRPWRMRPSPEGPPRSPLIKTQRQHTAFGKDSFVIPQKIGTSSRRLQSRDARGETLARIRRMTQ